MDEQNDTSPRWRFVAVVVVVLVAAIAAFVLLRDDGDDSDDAATTTPSSGDVSTTSESPATSTPGPDTTTPATSGPSTSEVVDTTSPPPPDAVDQAIWPWVDTPTRYADPVGAATGFAVDYLGFTDPVVGEFLEGDARSGEVEIRAIETGPVTTVLVRQLADDDSWWILAAIAENITVDEPEAGTEITSPVEIAGTALAFEGTVELELRADGNGEPILEGFVTASGGPEAGPFRESFEFTSPGDTGGALVLWSRSPEDGSVIEAAALRVFYR